MAAPVTVHYWPQRFFSPGHKSLTGHVALQGPGMYVSWAPAPGGMLPSVARGVTPDPRPTYEFDCQRAGGARGIPVTILTLDAEAMRKAWIGMAANLADPAFYGPSIAYQLAPSASAGPASSCATFVVKLLRAGGSDALVPWTQASLVTPYDVHKDALRLSDAKRR